jgi:hypothetical protein
MRRQDIRVDETEHCIRGFGFEIRFTFMTRLLLHFATAIMAHFVPASQPEGAQ